MKRIGSVFLILLFSTSCNLWDPFSNPSGDAQLLDAARAALDNEDCDQAREYYKEISDNQPYKDFKNSELAYLELDCNMRVNLGNFLKAFAGGDGGAGITHLTNQILENATPGADLRQVALDAYLKHQEVEDAARKALVKFVTASALVAEFLAETGGDGADSADIFSAQDIVTTPDACRAYADETACIADTGGDCTPPGSSQIAQAVFAGELTDLTEITTLNYGHVNKAISQIAEALGELQASGGFGKGAGKFAESIENLASNTNDNCYLYGLLQQGIGAPLKGGDK